MLSVRLVPVVVDMEGPVIVLPDDAPVPEEVSVELPGEEPPS